VLADPAKTFQKLHRRRDTMLEELKPPENNICALAKKRLELSETDQAILDDALANTNWAAHSLHFALKDLGFHVSKDLLGHHRKGACKCYKI